MKNKSFRLVRPLIVVLAVLALLGCGGGGEDDGKTNLRFVNAVSGVDAVDLVVDLEIFFEDVQYLESSGYFSFDTEPHIFQITPSNSLTPIDETKTSLSDDVDFTYLAYGSAADAEAMLLKDDNSSPSGDVFKVRTINVAPSLRSLDVFIVTDPEDVGSVAPTEDGLAYKETPEYRVGGAGTYFVVVADGKTGRLIQTSAGQSFEGGGVYTIILSDDPFESEPLSITILRDA
ncbi:MAG: hypothetical protein RL417_2179 [Pseudomonadota bacterium]|jgi:hypothetical protein